MTPNEATQTAEAPSPRRVDLNRATSVGPEERAAILDRFEYHGWGPTQVANGNVIRNALVAATEAVIDYAPPGPDRTVALRKLHEAGMDANSAITHNGKY